MKKIQWKKGEWINKGWGNYRLDRLSKCEKYIIHKWQNENNYFISYLVEFQFDDDFISVKDHGGLKSFSSLKKAKEYINMENRHASKST